MQMGAHCSIWSRLFRQVLLFNVWQFAISHLDGIRLEPFLRRGSALSSWKQIMDHVLAVRLSVTPSCWDNIQGISLITEPERGISARKIDCHITSHHITFSRRPYLDLQSLGLSLDGQWKCVKARESFSAWFDHPSHITCSAKAYRERREQWDTLFDRITRFAPSILSAASSVPFFKVAVQFCPLTQGSRVWDWCRVVKRRNIYFGQAQVFTLLIVARILRRYLTSQAIYFVLSCPIEWNSAVELRVP